MIDRRGPGRVSIVGYTDDLGSAHHGLVLSRQRAAAVARVLQPKLDKADYTFRVSGRGEADPAVPNTSEKNRKLNRALSSPIGRADGAMSKPLIADHRSRPL